MSQTRQSASIVMLGAAFLAAVFVSASISEGQSTPKSESELIAVLRSDAPTAEKALACKSLSVYGSSAAVPVLTPLLSDEQLASWARIALEAIPGAASDEALRKAAESLQGRLLIGAINSLGVRRVAAAVDLLIARLQDADADVASAAAVALGRIGNASSATALRKALAGEPVKARSAVAEGCILCAERSLANGKATEAAAIYDEVRKADVPWQRMLEGTRGAILARGSDGVPLLLEQLRSPHKGIFQIGLSTAREMSGTAVDKALGGEIERATPERAALIIVAMADRQDTVDLPAVLKAAGRGPKPVRLAAVAALGRVGDGTCLMPLLEVAVEPDTELVQAAKTALADLPSEKIDSEITARLATAQGKVYPVLIEVVGQRRIEATPALVKALDHSDKAVRAAALAALGNTVSPKDLSVLIAQVVSPKRADDAAAAQLALKTAAIRMPDREECAGQLASALQRSPTPTKVVLLEILSEVGGTKALHAVGTAAKTSDPLLQDASSGLLGKWMTADAAPVLLDLAKSSPQGDKYQVRAMRGYIRIARQFVMPEAERVAMCRQAFEATKQPAEQKLVIEVLKRYPSLDMLKLAVNAMQNPQLKDDASQAVVAIAQKLGDQADAVRELLSKVALSKVKLEIVKAEYGAGATQKDVTETLQKQAADIQLISLPVSNYNAAFGGDPAPNSQKQLKVQYRINGKDAEATFPENALIVLPMPK